MDERLFARLATRLAEEPVVLASVRATRGAVPRTAGARMLVGNDWTQASVGGGAAEARVVDAARALLASGDARGEVAIDLTGRPGAQGVCGGSMTVVLERWAGADALARARGIADTLARGAAVRFENETLAPNERLLIVGGGHCAAALCDLARQVDFELVVHDSRAASLDAALFPDATLLRGPAALIATALDTPRTLYAVLLNRDYVADVEALAVLATRPPAFIGMMGSARRIGTVRDALPEHAALLARVHAPVGIEIEAQTPHEIAVSILAQLIAFRRGVRPTHE